MKLSRITNIPLSKSLLILFFIFVFGFLLRIWRIDQAPKGALIDELHFGYLAHSLIQTGADEHGQKWPIIFEGFGDQKLPAMAYLDIPSVAAFGLTVLAIRIPSVIAGSLLILSVYWLIKEVHLENKWALMGAFLTAVSPWTFFLSRFGFESNLGLLFFTTGLASLLRGQNKNKKLWYFFSGFSLALTWYSYIPYRPVTIALIVIFLGAQYLQKKLNRRVTTLLIAFCITIIPLFAPSVIGVNSTRFDQVGITSESSIVAIINEKRSFCHLSGVPSTFCFAAWNKPIFMLRELSRRYLMSFSPDFLVNDGEVNTDFLTINGFGQFFPILYPFFLIGLGGLLFSEEKIKPHIKYLIFSGLLLTPIPSALVGEPQKVRISALFPFILVVIVYGIYFIEKKFAKNIHKQIFLVLLIGIITGYTYLYQIEYHAVNAIQNEYKYQSYLPELFNFIETLPEETHVSIYPFFSDPLMFYAFYTKMDPAEYQSLAVIDEPDGANFRHTIELGSIHAYKSSIEATGCLAQEQNIPAVYVTNKFINDAEIIYEGKATNGVHTYVYAYNAKEYMKFRNCYPDAKN